MLATIKLVAVLVMLTLGWYSQYLVVPVAGTQPASGCALNWTTMTNTNWTNLTNTQWANLCN